ncbi:hypothetical protein KM043_009744 [Ampulex compressa]|nr:hypothetical protein KM043_009744 [Ampulex compressa]
MTQSSFIVEHPRTPIGPSRCLLTRKILTSESQLQATISLEPKSTGQNQQLWSLINNDNFVFRTLLDKTRLQRIMGFCQCMPVLINSDDVP